MWLSKGSNKKITHLHRSYFQSYFGLAGMCSRNSWVPQATNFCLSVTAKTYFCHKSLLSTGQPGFHSWEPCNFLRPQPWPLTVLAPLLLVSKSGYTIFHTFFKPSWTFTSRSYIPKCLSCSLKNAYHFDYLSSNSPFCIFSLFNCKAAVYYSTARNYGTICRDFTSVESRFWSAVSPRQNPVLPH